jgi:hypothetical protein
LRETKIRHDRKTALKKRKRIEKPTESLEKTLKMNDFLLAFSKTRIFKALLLR